MEDAVFNQSLGFLSVIIHFIGKKKRKKLQENKIPVKDLSF